MLQHSNIKHLYITLIFSYVKLCTDCVQPLQSMSEESHLVREPSSENSLDFIFAATPCEQINIVPDTNCISSAIRKFMLDMPSPGIFQNIALLI